MTMAPLMGISSQAAADDGTQQAEGEEDQKIGHRRIIAGL
jgi:hypothetical protein